MEAIEFQASVEDGMIRVPAEYQSRLTMPLRVILVAEPVDGPKNMIDELLKNPRPLKDFVPLSRDEIYE